ILTAVQDSSVNLGVQRFYAAVQHLREAGEVGDVFHRNARVAQQLGGGSRRGEFNAKHGGPAGGNGQSGFVGGRGEWAAHTGHDDLGRKIRMVTGNFISYRRQASGGWRQAGKLNPEKI